MSPLAKQIIDTLSKEEDTTLLAEVLDFYEYVKQKRLKEKWDTIQEVDPTEEEVKICEIYQHANHEFISLNSLVQELGLDE